MSKALALINTLDREGFIALLGPLYEHSPWAAASAFDSRPFANRAALDDALRRAVDDAGVGEQVALIRAHPDLAREKLPQHTMTAASVGEQASLRLEEMSERDLDEWALLNARYRERFGFPFVICVRLHNRNQVISAMRSRLQRDGDTEAGEAIRQIHDIARLRLNDLIARLDA